MLIHAKFAFSRKKNAFVRAKTLQNRTNDSETLTSLSAIAMDILISEPCVCCRFVPKCELNLTYELFGGCGEKFGLTEHVLCVLNLGRGGNCKSSEINLSTAMLFFRRNLRTFCGFTRTLYSRK